MSDPMDDLFGDDPEFLKAQEESERHGEALYEFVSQYAADHQLADEFVADLSFEAGLRLRIMGYLADTAKPSGTGLKLDLDHCLRDFEDMIRDYKKTADEFVRAAEEAIAAAQKGEAPGSG